MIFYSTAFFMEICYPSVLAMAEFANEENRLFGFNLAGDYILEKYYEDERLSTMLEYSDFIFCNKDEALACGMYMRE